jgi:hypothetical protein
MPNWPKNRRGKNETLEHYEQRLIDDRIRAYRSSVKHQWGEFLNDIHWDFVGHYTFEKPYSIDGAASAFERYLKMYPICYAYFSIEDRSRPHVHALIGRIDNMNVLPWGLGWYQIQQFDKSKGAAWYVSKCPSQNWQMFGGFPKEKPAHCDKWWRPDTTLDPTNIVGLCIR